jgi:hypothetical protein
VGGDFGWAGPDRTLIISLHNIRLTMQIVDNVHYFQVAETMNVKLQEIRWYVGFEKENGKHRYELRFFYLNFPGPFRLYVCLPYGPLFGRPLFWAALIWALFGR